MPSKRTSLKTTVYMLLSVILPIVLIIVNHMFWIDNILLSIVLLSWMGFSMLALQPFNVGEFETIEP